MVKLNGRTSDWRLSHVAGTLAGIVSLAALSPAYGVDVDLEREQIAALVRQIELADRLADHLAGQTDNAAPDRARYHFDVDRLRADLQRIRAGLQDYLSPQRAQPRDPSPLSGAYLQPQSAESSRTPSKDGSP